MSTQMWPMEICGVTHKPSTIHPAGTHILTHFATARAGMLALELYFDVHFQAWVCPPLVLPPPSLSLLPSPPPSLSPTVSLLMATFINHNSDPAHNPNVCQQIFIWTFVAGFFGLFFGNFFFKSLVLSDKYEWPFSKVVSPHYLSNQEDSLLLQPPHSHDCLYCLSQPTHMRHPPVSGQRSLYLRLPRLQVRRAAREASAGCISLGGGG